MPQEESQIEDLANKIDAFIRVTCESQSHARFHLIQSEGNVVQALNDHFAGEICSEDPQLKKQKEGNDSQNSIVIDDDDKNNNNNESDEDDDDNKSVGSDSTVDYNFDDDDDDDDDENQDSNNNNNSNNGVVKQEEQEENLNPSLREVMMSLVEQPSQSAASAKNRQQHPYHQTISDDDDDLVQMSDSPTSKRNNENSKSMIDVDNGIEYLSVGQDFQLSQNQIRDVMQQQHQQQQKGAQLMRLSQRQKQQTTNGLPARRSRSSDPPFASLLSNNHRRSSTQQQPQRSQQQQSVLLALSNSPSSSDNDDDDDGSNAHTSIVVEKLKQKLRKEREEIRKERIKLDALIAKNLAKEAELESERRDLELQKSELESTRLVVTLQKEELDLETAPPSYWTTIKILGNQAPAMVNIPQGSDLWNKIQAVFDERYITGGNQNQIMNMNNNNMMMMNNNNNYSASILIRDSVVNHKYEQGPFNGQSCPLKIEKITRVENPILWKLYLARRGAIASQIGGHSPIPQIKGFSRWAYEDLNMQQSVNETLLFHATKPAAVKQIAGGGFDNRISNTGGNFGAACYFASQSEKSHSYAAQDEDGLCYMFLCRVILGTPYVLPEGQTYNTRKPPCRNGCEYKKTVMPQQGGFGGWGAGAGAGRLRRARNRAAQQQQQQQQQADANNEDDENYISAAVRAGRPVCDEHLPSDSVVGSVAQGAALEYMVYESAQVYPEFLVTYRVDNNQNHGRW